MNGLKKDMVCVDADLIDRLLCADSTSGALSFLFRMIFQMDDAGYVVQTYEDLEESMGVSYTTVARRLKVLKDTRAILPCRSGRNNGNKYRINPEYVWIGEMKR